MESRILVVGWSSFVHGESTAGDVLVTEAVRRRLRDRGVPHDVAWSPVMLRAVHLGARAGDTADSIDVLYDEVDPAAYTHVLFVCGPVAGEQLAAMHRRFAHCRRIAVGVTVVDPGSSAVGGFHEIIARDSQGQAPSIDLSASVPVDDLPVVGVVLTGGQHEYGDRRRHDSVRSGLDEWMSERVDCAFVEIDTRLDPRDWHSASIPAQTEAVVRRCTAIVSMRLHGMVLALKNAVPVLAIDPVFGGGKVTEQARAWNWPALVDAEDVPGGRALEEGMRWVLSSDGRSSARRCADNAASLPPQQLRALDAALTFQQS